ncbi:hypothetical protein BDR26DRAFT_470553 [Obelidium mucronatum]|nr:hypothetical protein BDR26DRAFT_470553 [Obelidium mucronatum]
MLTSSILILLAGAAHGVVVSNEATSSGGHFVPSLDSKSAQNAADCSQAAFAVKGDTCVSFTLAHNISIKNLNALNGAGTCQRLIPGQLYCLSKPAVEGTIPKNENPTSETEADSTSPIELISSTRIANTTTSAVSTTPATTKTTTTSTRDTSTTRTTTTSTETTIVSTEDFARAQLIPDATSISSLPEPLPEANEAQLVPSPIVEAQPPAPAPEEVPQSPAPLAPPPPINSRRDIYQFFTRTLARG